PYTTLFRSELDVGVAQELIHGDGAAVVEVRAVAHALPLLQHVVQVALVFRRALGPAAQLGERLDAAYVVVAVHSSIPVHVQDGEQPADLVLLERRQRHASSSRRFGWSHPHNSPGAGNGKGDVTGRATHGLCLHEKAGRGVAGGGRGHGGGCVRGRGGRRGRREGGEPGAGPAVSYAVRPADRDPG